jgi:hypothetical protein
MKISVYRSPDGRLRTEKYGDGGGSFCVAEKLASGTLITEFKANGEVLNQAYSKVKEGEGALSEYLGPIASIELVEVPAYELVVVAASCTKCGTETIARDLDRQDTRKVYKVPVIPLFVCSTCKTRFYSLTDAYLKRLIEGNVSLFEKGEIEQRDKNEMEFVHELHEYIIRIFASKRIHKLNFRG